MGVDAVTGVEPVFFRFELRLHSTVLHRTFLSAYALNKQNLTRGDPEGTLSYRADLVLVRDPEAILEVVEVPLSLERCLHFARLSSQHECNDPITLHVFL